MNRAQIGVVVVAVLGVVALSGAATTFQAAGGGGGNQSDIETIPIEELNGTPTQVYIEPVEGRAGGGGVPEPGEEDGDQPGDDDSTTHSDTLTLSRVLLGIVAVVLVVAAIVGARLMHQRDRTDEDEIGPESPSDEAESEEEDDEEDDDAIEDLGRSAGRAADHLADTERPSNAVHRAWYEMTRHLDVSNPRASTPEEFANAAVAAGMDREDVTALTTQFELVRYAGRDTTPERVSTAETALRRIEDKYTEGS